jgi:predicted metal-dependent enzyme (double-stranded beta helix superfamily)
MACDWLVTNEGSCEPVSTDTDNTSPERTYRLYRFLTDLEDILDSMQSDRDRLDAIRPLVRRLLTDSDWLQGEYLEPDPETGWSVLMLYDEPDFPITIQTVVWLPGQVSPIHNHAAWGLVAMLQGREKNRFWRRCGDSQYPNRVELAGEQTVEAGEIITFLPDAIHSIEAMGDEPTVSFNLYGVTDFENRLEFDLETGTARNF